MKNKSRLVRPFQVKSFDADAGKFSGYASVFGELDSYRDVVHKGAFADTVGDYSPENPLPMLWQHRDAEPIGVYTKMVEDDHGLYVEGEINLEVQRGRECRALMKQRALSGLSIGYELVDFKDDGKKMVRNIHKVKLWEISPVTFPAGPTARVIEAKSYDELNTLRECEDALHNMFGLSKSEATAMVARIVKASKGRQGEPAIDTGDWQAVLMEVKKITQTF